MKVYVLTFGCASYEEGVVVAGVYKTEEQAILEGQKETIYPKQGANFGNYWYNVEEFDLE